MELRGNKGLAWAGAFAFTWFFGWMFCIAALRPEYHHATKSVSELGALGSPYMAAWNALGFVGTGVLLALFALGYRAVLGERAAGFRALLLTAALFALTANPIAMGADGDPDRTAQRTLIHLAFVLLAPLPWAWALIAIIRRYRGSAHRALAMASAIALAAVVALVVFGATHPDFHAPGWLQRANFAIVLGWYAAAAFVLRTDGRGTIGTT